MTPSQATEPTSRPSNVTRFEQLMYFTLGIGVLGTFRQWNRLVSDPRLARLGGVAFLVSTQIIAFGILVLLIWLVARRRKNWARWLTLVMFVLGTPSALRIIGHTLHIDLLAGSLMCVQLIMQIVALFLIFTGNASDWFARGSVSKFSPVN
jgi:hypothetical protein